MPIVNFMLYNSLTVSYNSLAVSELSIARGDKEVNRIKELREAQGMMQKELAEKANVSRPYLHDLENNRRGAKPETLQRIADALGVSAHDLIAKAG